MWYNEVSSQKNITYKIQGLCGKAIGHVSMGIVVYVMEIPNEFIEHQVKIWLAFQHQVKNTASWLVDNGKNEKA